MKKQYRQNLFAVALVGALAITTAQAQQYPIPTTAAEVSGPAPGTAMTKEYVQMVGRMAYMWGWPLVTRADLILPIVSKRQSFCGFRLQVFTI